MGLADVAEDDDFATHVATRTVRGWLTPATLVLTHRVRYSSCTCLSRLSSRISGRSRAVAQSRLFIALARTLRLLFIAVPLGGGALPWQVNWKGPVCQTKQTRAPQARSAKREDASCSSLRLGLEATCGTPSLGGAPHVPVYRGRHEVFCE